MGFVRLLCIVVLAQGAMSPQKDAEAPPAVKSAQSRPGRPARGAGKAAGKTNPKAVAVSSCDADRDCTFSFFSPGECCPMLCQPRPIAKKQADAEEADRRARCAKPPRPECSVPSCAPASSAAVPACEKGRCVARPIKLD